MAKLSVSTKAMIKDFILDRGKTIMTLYGPYSDHWLVKSYVDNITHQLGIPRATFAIDYTINAVHLARAFPCQIPVKIVDHYAGSDTMLASL